MDNLELAVRNMRDDMRAAARRVFRGPGYEVPDDPLLRRIRLARYRQRAGRLLPDVRR